MISISIHIIANLPIDNFGRIYLEKPSDFTQFKFANEKYFKHVGIFLQSSFEHDKYIYLTDIENIIQNGSKTFVYSINDKDKIFCIENYNHTCYKQLNNSNLEFYENILTNKFINYSITFQFIRPNFYYLLGDIHYNIIRCDLKNFYIDDKKFFLHYYRFKTNFNQFKLPVVYNEFNQTYRYYDINQDFQPIEYLWKTGLSKCTTTSSYSPHRSQDIQIDHSYC